MAAEALTHPIDASSVLMAFAVGLPVVVFLLMVWALHVPLSSRPGVQAVVVLVAIAATLAIAAATGVGVSLSWVVALVCVPVAGVIAVGVAEQHRAAAADGRGR